MGIMPSRAELRERFQDSLSASRTALERNGVTFMTVVLVTGAVGGFGRWTQHRFVSGFINGVLSGLAALVVIAVLVFAWQFLTYGRRELIASRALAADLRQQVADLAAEQQRDHNAYKARDADLGEMILRLQEENRHLLRHRPTPVVINAQPGSNVSITAGEATTTTGPPDVRIEPARPSETPRDEAE